MSQRKEQIEAQADAIERKVDRYIRAAARAGKDLTGHGINYEARREITGGRTLTVRATSGAGTNSSSVRLEQADGTEVLVYEASEHGRHLHVYRTGSWVDELVAWGGEAERQGSNEREMTAKERNARIAANFAPLDE